jgi:hypothetical protein
MIDQYSCGLKVSISYSRRAGARELAPEHRRQREADEVVERPARQIGVDQRLVDGARLAQGRLHRILGDGVEGDALDRDALQGPLLVQRLQHVPGDGLALAIRVGGENQLLGALDRLGDLRDALAAAAVQFPDHAEIGLGIHGAVLRGQVANMAERGQDLVALAQILVDRLGLCRRLDDEDLHGLSLGLVMLKKAEKPGQGPGRFAP